MRTKLLSALFCCFMSITVSFSQGCGTPPPSAAGTQHMCENSRVADLAATGTTLQWYTTATGGVALNPQTLLTTSQYFVSQLVNGCESARTEVSVTALGQPTYTSYYVWAGATYPGNNPIERWYSVPDGGAPLQEGAVLEQGNYYVSYFTSTCETARTTVYVVVVQPVNFYQDVDNDGFGNQETVTFTVAPPAGYILQPGDCDDADPGVGLCEDTVLTKLEPQFCGYTQAAVNVDVMAIEVPDAEAYRFRVFNGQNTQIIEKTIPSFNMLELDSHQFSSIYNVEVAVFRYGSWSPYGETCPVVMPASPVTKIKSSQCNSTVPLITTPIQADAVPGAGQYRFRITGAGVTQTIEKQGSSFRFTELASYAYGVEYTVDVSVSLYGKWSFYGSACTVATPSTQVRASQCGMTVTSFDTSIYAVTMANATGYRFRITSPDNSVIIVDKNTNSFKLSETADYQYSTAYSIDVAARVNGAFGPYGAACTVNSPNLLLPKIKEAHCGAEVAFASYIYAEPVTLATAYRFRVASSYGTQVLERNVNRFRLNELSNYGYATDYQIEVSAFVSGNWTQYGASCTVHTASNLPVTRLKEEYCNRIYPSFGLSFYAVIVPGATTYRFRVTNGANVQILDRPANSMKMNMLASYAFYTNYTIEVAVMIGGVWSDYGDACAVNFIPKYVAASEVATGDSEATGGVTSLTAYPNPSSTSFVLDIVTEDKGMVNIQVFDLTGKLLDAMEASPEELSSKTFGNHYSAGIYNVIVTQGDYQKSMKLVKN